MRLLEAIPATRLATTAAGGLDRSIGLAILRSRIGTTLAGTALDRLAITISAILAVSTIASISPVTPIIVAVTIAEAVLVLVAPEGTIAIGVVTRMAILLPALMLIGLIGVALLELSGIKLMPLLILRLSSNLTFFTLSVAEESLLRTFISSRLLMPKVKPPKRPSLNAPPVTLLCNWETRRKFFPVESTCTSW